MDDDAEHSSIEVGHGRTEEKERPNEGVLVNEFQVEVDVVAALEVLYDLLELPLQIVGNAKFVFGSLKTLLSPTEHFYVDRLTYDSQTPKQLLVVENPAHLVARTLEWHLLELGAILVGFLHLVDGLYVGIIVPQEAALAEILEGLKLLLGRCEVVFGIVADDVLLVRRDNLVILLQTFDDRDANSLVMNLSQLQPLFFPPQLPPHKRTFAVYAFLSFLS